MNFLNRLNPQSPFKIHSNPRHFFESQIIQEFGEHYG